MQEWNREFQTDLDCLDLERPLAHTGMGGQGVAGWLVGWLVGWLG